MRFTLITLFTCLYCISFANDTNKEEVKKIANNLAECGGIYTAMGTILDSLDKPHASQTYIDTGRGAYLAGGFMMHTYKNIPNWENAIAWSENIKETRNNYWLGLMEVYTPTQENPFPKEFMEALHFCTLLAPIQKSVVEMMKQEMYSQKP